MEGKLYSSFSSLNVAVHFNYDELDLAFSCEADMQQLCTISSSIAGL